MDWFIRLSILIIGLILVGYIVYDFNKKHALKKKNEKLKRQFNSTEADKDASGFDYTGVGTARVATIDGELPAVEAEHKKLEQIEGSTLNEYLSRNEDNHDDSTDAAPNLSASELSNKKDPTFDEQDNNALTDGPELVFCLILQAPEGSLYKGRDFLPLFLSQGLRLGDMDIFHRYISSKINAEKGELLFSLANAINPGTFNPANLESFETPAFTLFMALPGPKEPQKAYEVMVKIARLLKEELGGHILDESKALYSDQIHQRRLESINQYSN